MNINSLPDVVLRHIFSYLPLLEQLYLHHVCPKWKSLQFSVTSGRKCLTLFVGEQTDPPARSLIDESTMKIPHLDQIESDSARKPPQESTLEFSKLHDNLTTHLVSLFPNISSLCLVLNLTGFETVDQVIILLKSWCEKLDSLSFYCQFIWKKNYDYENHWIESTKQHFKLIRFIDQKCLTLDSLTFDVDERCVELNQTNLHLPCLARLKEFQFCSGDNAKILFRSLKQYGNGRLERITIANHYNDGDVMAEFAQHPQIAAKFVALPNFRIPTQRQLFVTFNSLTTLSIGMDNLTLPEFTSYLAPLHNLIHLQLSLQNVALFEYDSTPTYEFYPLKSVKILRLMTNAKSHDNLSSRHWSTIFPSIQFVQIRPFRALCNMCLIEDPTKNQNWTPHGSLPRFPKIEPDKKKHCLNMLMEQLKQCEQLKKIVINECTGIPRTVHVEWNRVELN